ncbi:hypothetical protein [Pseudonocardia sp. HH130629-09]|uniref:hypothetical protein n=1 Tax=Pseudonocardia sp. HH130629-09 TaxID=1641402 RepID=UPI00076112EC|nr:hypothetical protein [Pseudonocardia sp. HH130629-09]
MKALGARLSLADRGVTFGSATERGVCIRFHRPVPALDPFGTLRHPGITVTIADPERLVAAVERYAERTRLTTARRTEPTCRAAASPTGCGCGPGVRPGRRAPSGELIIAHHLASR